ncbi:hypothetical protein [Chamaesiphon polymorphus]|uniref:hypothetical protein n=1 Tax=Chamaesiphon polymorphus TaxID=2107691 RepID=UPI0015E68C90|nr:hypothetical protein [Chamaesiphon polymorphus]
MESLDRFVKSTLDFYHSRQFNRFCKLTFLAFYATGLAFFLMNPTQFWNNWSNFLN